MQKAIAVTQVSNELLTMSPISVEGEVTRDFRGEALRTLSTMFSRVLAGTTPVLRHHRQRGNDQSASRCCRQGLARRFGEYVRLVGSAVQEEGSVGYQSSRLGTVAHRR